LSRLSFREKALLLVGLAPIFVALLWYAVSWSFVWDEGFHLVAAQLIAGGLRPYLDFCFPQTPLNAYANAAILLVAGNHWRPVHVVAALYVCGAVFLVAHFVQSRLPPERWRTPCALAAAVLFGLNVVVVQYGPTAQAYAIGMLMGTSAFRAALRAVSSRYVWFALLAGLCAGVAAGSTLLTAPVSLVLLVWMIWSHQIGSRVRKTAAYLVGCALPFAPVGWFYLQAPRQTLFNVLQYQALFRRTNWGDANLHDMDALTSWIASPATLMLIGFFAAAVIFLYRERHSDWPQARREFMLAAVLGVSLVLFISTAHPTFDRYYSVAVPYFGITAALGLYAAASRLATPRHAWLAGGLVIALGWSIFLRALFDEREDEHWSDYEEMAQQIGEATPIGANLYADELIYFLLDRTPPEGMAFSYAAKLQLPADQEKLFHIRSQQELKQQMQAGGFETFQTCRDAIVDDFEPGKYFQRHSEPGDCDIFWQPKQPPVSTGKR